MVSVSYEFDNKDWFGTLLDTMTPWPWPITELKVLILEQFQTQDIYTVNIFPLVRTKIPSKIKISLFRVFWAVNLCNFVSFGNLMSFGPTWGSVCEPRRGNWRASLPLPKAKAQIWGQAQSCLKADTTTAGHIIIKGRARQQIVLDYEISWPYSIKAT